MSRDRQQATHLLELLWIEEESAVGPGHVAPDLLQSLVAFNVGLNVVDSDTLKGRVRRLLDSSPAHGCREHLALSFGYILGLFS